MIGNPEIWYVGFLYPWSTDAAYPPDSPLSSEGLGAPSNLQGVLSFSSRAEAEQYCREHPDRYLYGPFRHWG
jgi:hypothetical protein